MHVGVSRCWHEGGLARGRLALHYVVDVMVRLLDPHNHSAHDIVDIGCVCLECVHGGLNSHVCIEVDVVGENVEFVVHCLGEFFHGLGERLL